MTAKIIVKKQGSEENGLYFIRKAQKQPSKAVGVEVGHHRATRGLLEKDKLIEKQKTPDLT